MPQVALRAGELAEERTKALQQALNGIGEALEGALWMVATEIKAGTPKTLGLSNGAWADSVMPRRKFSIAERQRLVNELVAQDLSNRQIADVLGVTHTTIQRDLDGTFVPAEAENEEAGMGEGDTFVPASSPPHVTHNSGDHEWYTPEAIIAAAREVLGAIDLDPASSALANTVVGATRFYTEADDGLLQPWAGRIWMNPPYKSPLIERFTSRLVREHRAGAVGSAITIVNNATDTAWFQELVAVASGLCLPRGRVRYWHPEKESVQGLQGQVLAYLGPDPVTFCTVFRRFGVVVIPADEGMVGNDLDPRYPAVSTGT